jgi:ribonuclease P protein component
MNKYYKITKNDFKYLMSNKSSYHNLFFGITYCFTTNSDNHFHYLISISKKYGNAVNRNLAKKRLRAILTLNLADIRSDCRMLIIIKPQLSQLSYQDMTSCLTGMFKKVGIINGN